MASHHLKSPRSSYGGVADSNQFGWMEESKGGKVTGATQGSGACLLGKGKHLSKEDKCRKSKASEGSRERQEPRE